MKGDSSTKIDGRDRATAAAVPAAGGERAGTASMHDGHSAAPPPPGAATTALDDAQPSAAGTTLSSGSGGVVVSGAALRNEQEAPADAARAGAVSSTLTSFTEEASDRKRQTAENRTGGISPTWLPRCRFCRNKW